jgi:hypothetical protein
MKQRAGGANERSYWPAIEASIREYTPRPS